MRLRDLGLLNYVEVIKDPGTFEDVLHAVCIMIQPQNSGAKEGNAVAEMRMAPIGLYV